MISLLTILLLLSFQSKSTALMLAAQNGHNDIVKYLIQKGANVHTSNEVNLLIHSGFVIPFCHYSMTGQPFIGHHGMDMKILSCR